MPFRIVRDDLTKIQADAIVNTANPDPVIGRGTDCAVYMTAGKKDKKLDIYTRGRRQLLLPVICRQNILSIQ